MRDSTAISRTKVTIRINKQNPFPRTQHLITSESHRTEMATSLLSTLTVAASHTLSPGAVHSCLLPTARR